MFLVFISLVSMLNKFLVSIVFDLTEISPFLHELNVILRFGKISLRSACFYMSS